MLSSLASFFRQAAALPPPYQNPLTRGHIWYHGTLSDFDNEDEARPHHTPQETAYDENDREPKAVKPYPGGYLRHTPPEPDPDWPGNNSARHWNTDLGTHFAADRSVANQYFAKLGNQPSSRIAHVNLHMANPKVYGSEHDMSREAVAWAKHQGYSYLADPHDPEHDQKIAQGYGFSDLGDEDDQARTGHLVHTGEEHARRYLGLDRMSAHDAEARTDSGHGHRLSGDHAEEYLANHPDREEITAGFKAHLQSQGHDGVLYENEHERGNQSSTSAITFDDEQIHQKHWEWLHPSKQRLNPKDAPSSVQRARQTEDMEPLFVKRPAGDFHPPQWEGHDRSDLGVASMLRQHFATAGEPYLHASNVLFQPGDTIHPASAVPGVKSPYAGNNEHYSPDHVYMYRASEIPKGFRLQGQAIYEVEPHGEVEPDPEPFRGKPISGSYRTKGPATVKRMVSNNWRDPSEDIPEGMRGPGWRPSEQPRPHRIEGSLTSKEEAEHTGACIVALPAKGHPVHGIGPEEKHATLVWLGDTREHPTTAGGKPWWTEDDVADGIRRWLADPMAGGGFQPFSEPVSHIQDLGGEGARVWMLQGQTLPQIHEALKSIPAVGDLYGATKQFPSYTPHSTIGYGEEAKDAEDRAQQVTSIPFDRLALWWGGKHTEFPLAQHLTAGANGDLPGGLRYQAWYRTDPTSGERLQDGTAIATVHHGEDLVGHLRWNYHTEPSHVMSIGVEPEYRRRGVATSLFHWVKGNHQSDLEHSKLLTDDGRAFRNSFESKRLIPEGMDHGIFSATKETLDPVLWTQDEKLFPVVKRTIMDRLDQALSPTYPDWLDWSRVYFAGGEASYWWGGSRDFDTLIGIDYDAFRKAHPDEAEKSNDTISVDITAIFRARFNSDHFIAPWDGQEWSITAFVNSNSFDIRNIHPYAAYDIVHDKWVVKPVRTPSDWSAASFDPAMWEQIDAYLSAVRAIGRIHDPRVRAAQGAALYNYLHEARKQAFGPDGEGWKDPFNAIWKALEYAPSDPVASLVTWVHEHAEYEQQGVR